MSSKTTSFLSLEAFLHRSSIELPTSPKSSTLLPSKTPSYSSSKSTDYRYLSSLKRSTIFTPSRTSTYLPSTKPPISSKILSSILLTISATLSSKAILNRPSTELSTSLKIFLSSKIFSPPSSSKTYTYRSFSSSKKSIIFTLSRRLIDLSSKVSSPPLTKSIAYITIDDLFYMFDFRRISRQICIIIYFKRVM